MNFRDMINAVVKTVMNETERQFTNEQVPGWYLVDNGNVADGPFDDESQAQERAAYSSEKAQYWDGHQWAQTEASSGMLPDGTEVTIKIGNVDQGRTGVIRGEDDSDPDAGTEWARYRIEFPDGGHIYKKKHQFDVVANESDDHNHTDDCQVCDSNLMELPEDIEDGLIEGVDELDEGMFDTKKSKYFPEATDLDDGHAVDMAWEWILVDLREHPQADESEIYRFVMSTQAEKELTDKDAQFIRLRAEEYIANGGRLGESNEDDLNDDDYLDSRLDYLRNSSNGKGTYDVYGTMVDTWVFDSEEAANMFVEENSGWSIVGTDEHGVHVADDEDLENISMEEDVNHMGEHEYHSFASWRMACRKRNPDVWFDGDRDIANAMVGPKPFIPGETISMGEWDGEVGVIYAPVHEATVDRNPNIKQNQPADLMKDILAKDENGDEMDSNEIDRLKQLAGLK